MWVLLPSSCPLLGQEVILAPYELSFEPGREGAARWSGAAKPDAMWLFQEVESVCRALACEMHWPVLNYVPVILTEGSPCFTPFHRSPRLIPSCLGADLRFPASLQFRNWILSASPQPASKHLCGAARPQRESPRPALFPPFLLLCCMQCNCIELISKVLICLPPPSAHPSSRGSGLLPWSSEAELRVPSQPGEGSQLHHPTPPLLLPPYSLFCSKIPCQKCLEIPGFIARQSCIPQLLKASPGQHEQH